MSDVKRYVQQRAERDAEFAENYEVGYADFKKRQSRLAPCTWAAQRRE